ncbi:MAG: MoaD/ThiS family protein [Candidatus Geothermincolia bacterium]
MMRIKTRYIGLFARYMGEKVTVFEVDDGSTAGDLLYRLGEERGSRLPRSLWDAGAGRFHKSIKLARCGGPTLAPADPLNDGEEVFVIFPLAGG